MTEQSRRRDSSPRLRPGSQPKPPQPGWRVTPAPDGRGRTPAKPPSGPNPRWLALLLIVALLALNFWVSSQVLGPNPRVRIPYSPTFLAQVNQQNVNAAQATLKGDQKILNVDQAQKDTACMIPPSTAAACDAATLTVAKDVRVAIEGKEAQLADVKADDATFATLRLSLDQKEVQGISVGRGR